MTDKDIYKKLSTNNMYQLKNLSTTVTKSEDHYTVIYSLNEKEGYCKYMEKPSMTRLQPGIHLLLVEVNMKDIIDELNKISPLSEKDLQSLQMGIREDSLDRVNRFIYPNS
jgi:hypothetical protein